MAFSSWEEKEDKPDIDATVLFEAVADLVLPGMTWIEKAPNYGLLYDSYYCYVFQSNKILGTSSNSLVYQAWKIEEDGKLTPCVVKAIPLSSKPSEITADEFKGIFVNEAKHVQKVSTGPVSSIITTEYLYLVQPLAKGDPIQDSSGKPHPQLKDLKPSEKTELVIQILNQLKTIHDQDIVHGDINNQNIMFYRDRDGKFHASIIDFGNSQDLKGAESVKAALASPGSPGYIPPEREKGVFAKGSDIFALGTVISFIYGKNFLEKSDFSKKTKEALKLSLNLHLIKMTTEDPKERFTVDQSIQYFQVFNRVLENYSAKKSALQSSGLWKRLTSDDFEILKKAAEEEKFNLFSNKL